ncbi:MAG: MFS transporter [Planctomycetaceae bacterium]|jgi:MFS family permease
MHGFEELAPTDSQPQPGRSGPWHRELNRYHWFVLIVAALGWLFDTMDQQLFNLARVPAMKALVTNADGSPADDKTIALYGGYATSIFLIGWATGGLAFGVLGDRIGRAKTMLLTILIYSLCTGLSALSKGFWDFAFYRFITGLGVGGEFAVGVSLVAEVMPDRARPFALGLLQALSAVGNITAALISIVLGHLEESGAVGSAWRWMFVIGTLPALLAILIRRRLKEPERWQQTAADRSQGKKTGSYGELFGDPRWRRRAIVGLLMAFAGVVGLWGIGFFSVDLIRLVLNKRLAAADVALLDSNRDERISISDVPAAWQANVKRVLDSINQPEAPIQDFANGLVRLNAPNGGGYAGEFIRLLGDESSPEMITLEALPAPLQERLRPFYDREQASSLTSKALQGAVGKSNAGSLTRWAGITSMFLNLGAFFGIYGFSYLTQWLGRKPAFAIAFLAAMFSTASVFAFLDSFTQIFWMIPLMGFCQLALFGGYAIYFPELFPTRLRSTGTSFCYNVGRFVAAIGPSLLGYLTVAFGDKPEPMRWAGVTMCSVFLLGLAVLPFAPETKGQPLPD